MENEFICDNRANSRRSTQKNSQQRTRPQCKGDNTEKRSGQKDFPPFRSSGIVWQPITICCSTRRHAIGSDACFASQFRNHSTVPQIKLALSIDSTRIRISKSSPNEYLPPTHLDIRLEKLLPFFLFKYFRFEYHELINDFYFPFAAVSNKSISTEITFFLFRTHTHAFALGTSLDPHHDVTYKHCIHFASTRRPQQWQ